jgi:hypothetical protein
MCEMSEIYWRCVAVTIRNTPVVVPIVGHDRDGWFWEPAMVRTTVTVNLPFPFVRSRAAATPERSNPERRNEESQDATRRFQD